jgi:hypothetical protein
VELLLLIRRDQRVSGVEDPVVEEPISDVEVARDLRGVSGRPAPGRAFEEPVVAVERNNEPLAHRSPEGCGRLGDRFLPDCRERSKIKMRADA